MIGKNDALIPYTDVLKQTYLPCISHIHLLQECGHMAMLKIGSNPQGAGGFFCPRNRAAKPLGHRIPCYI